MTSTPAPRTDEHRLVHAAIQAVAARCDGAVDLDYQGFDGTDTKYGRRIAAVDFETLTEDDKAEEARIVLKYRKQALAYTGTDVAELEVVREAQGFGTNYNSRDNARRYERKTKNAAKADLRKAFLFGDGANIVVSWVKGDPEFGALLDAVRALPDRRFESAQQGWIVRPSKALQDFILAWDFPLDADAARILKEAAEKPVYNVGVVGGTQGKRLWIKAGYDANRVAEARQLPGRRWTGEMDEVDTHPAVLAFAARWNLVVSPKVTAAVKAIEGDLVQAQATQTEKERRAAVLSQASRAGGLQEVPEDFLAMVRQAVGR